MTKSEKNALIACIKGTKHLADTISLYLTDSISVNAVKSNADNVSEKMKTHLENISPRNVQSISTFCPDCSQPMRFLHQMNTDWYGVLKYYRCSNCDSDWVDYRGELKIAAPH